ncbi:Os01g0499600 [Oryza sativa Japonica Group]|uniref:Os01g0499600 protein n=1 Tax=Oryza sativa subsp. japonica TaxID=39947 RepID=C7IXN2_ORYSJ|nr:Os01g0499600 [Oryza sativa Japonica Group]|eukprot:NP_001172369.1 Os01g0499600 [Oryza sativa Japonica Group]
MSDSLIAIKSWSGLSRIVQEVVSRILRWRASWFQYSRKLGILTKDEDHMEFDCKSINAATPNIYQS